MSTQLPDGHAMLQPGDHCPLCNAGVLHLIAENATGLLLKCFNCGRSGSVHREHGYQVQSVKGEAGTGFTQTEEQLAAKGALDTEQAVQRARAGDTISAEQPAAAGGNAITTPPPDRQEG